MNERKVERVKGPTKGPADFKSERDIWVEYLHVSTCM